MMRKGLVSICRLAGGLAGLCMAPRAGAVDAVLPALPFKRDFDAESLLLHYAGVLACLMLVLLLALAFALARRGGWRLAGGRPWRHWDWRQALRLAGSDGAVRILATRRLDTRSSLHVIEWEGSRLLIGRSDQGLTLLAQKPADGAQHMTTGPAS